jgi:hypothetical protein
MLPRRLVLCAMLGALLTGAGAAQDLRMLTAEDSTARTALQPEPAETLRTPRPEPRSTTTAILLSAALPGAGQAYNGSYWKAPLVLGLGIYLVAEAVDNNRKYRSYRDQYTASQMTLGPGGDTYLLKLRDFYASNRDTYIWYFVIMYVLNLVDAYVDASLSAFDVGSDLSFRALPGPSVQLRLRLP